MIKQLNYLKNLEEYLQEAKNLEDILDKIEYGIGHHSKLPLYQDMIKYLQSLNGVTVDIFIASKTRDKKPVGSRIVTTRHESKGKYVEVKYKNKTIFDQHTSDKDFTWNLAHAILKLASPDE
jgi:hypothetical protein